MEQISMELPKKPRKKRKEAITKVGKLNKSWAKFFERIRDIPEKISSWDQYHIIGYFCKRFVETYKAAYSFELKGAPSKCKELFLLRKIIFLLNNDNPRAIKNYIDWVFDKKIIPTNKRIYDFAFFTGPALINQFQISYVIDNKITRAMSLPQEYLEIAARFNIEIATYGDLAFIVMAIEQNGDGLEEYKKFIDDLIAINFNTAILKDLSD